MPIVLVLLFVFLLLALGTIAATEERAGHLKVRASFPRAFSGPKLQAYHACLDRVLRTVEGLTGFTTGISEPSISFWES